VAGDVNGITSLNQTDRCISKYNSLVWKIITNVIVENEIDNVIMNRFEKLNMLGEKRKVRKGRMRMKNIQDYIKGKFSIRSKR